MSERSRPALLALLFLVTFNAVLYLLSLLPALYDTDSYYHLAVARAYAENGLLRSFPWARLSALHDGFGDKELLFHVVLAPFASLPDPAVGGRVALALLNASIATVLGALATRAVGMWGLLLPAVVYAGSMAFTLRALRLRPELLALLLLLLAIDAVVKRRFLRLAVLAFLFTLSYTAFHALLLLLFLFFLADGLAGRGWDGRTVLAPAAGAAAALLVHPQFPANLFVWRLQNVDYFRLKEVLDVGAEIRPHPAIDLLALNAAWLVAMAALWLSRRRSAEPAADGRAAELWLIAAAAFGALYAAMMRFVVYAVPLATLALCQAMRARGQAPSRSVRLPWGLRLPLALVLGLSIASLAYTFRILLLNLYMAGTFHEEHHAELGEVSRALPAGARVAAPWTAAQAYVYWAPQGLYLNVLDPVFMAVPFPNAYAAQRALFEGDEPDPPLLAGVVLDSDHLAFQSFGAARALRERLAGDPRVSLLFEGASEVLAALRPSANASFVLDWRVAPSSEPKPRLAEPAGWTPYPRHATARGRELEGYVDLGRLGPPQGCRGLAHLFELAREETLAYELAPWGSTALYADGRLLAASQGERRAVLGNGVEVSVTLGPGPHRLDVTTCEASGRAGFYLREKGREAR